MTKNDAAPSVAIIGAGMAGLVCARTLQSRGVPVKVFEKSRGLGGRMSTRRTPEGLHFDHGAQYFTVRNERFAREVRQWEKDGTVAEWSGRIVTLTRGVVDDPSDAPRRYVGTPGMHSICKQLAAGLDVQLLARVESLEASENGWRLHPDSGAPLGKFDRVICTAPAPQSAKLLEPAPRLSQTIREVPMNGCWAVMVAFDQTLPLDFHGAFVHESPLSWIARNSAKPGRANQRSTPGKDCWVLHSSVEWTQQHLEARADDVRTALLDSFWQATRTTPKEASFSTAHRWLYAIPQPLEQRCLFDPGLGLGACGDWCGGPRVEGAFLSGYAMADRLHAELRR